MRKEECSIDVVGETGENCQTDLNGTWTFKGYRIRYLKLGTGEPILFLHNIGTDHHVWNYQIRHFARTNTVFALDLLGFGQSDHPDIDYTLELYTELLESFVAEQRLAPVTLVGLCVGAAMSLNYASRHPQNVKRLVLFNIESEATFKEGAFGYLHTISRLPGGGYGLDYISRHFKLPGFYLAVILRKLYGKRGLKAEPDVNYLGHLHYLFSKPDHFYIFIKSVRNLESYAAIDTLRIPENFPPLRVIWGEDNKVLPAAAGKQLCSRLNCSNVHFVKESGHFVMREKHAVINTMIGDFMEDSRTG
jgi:pimeloyl-ACP methyl ester carboxylesterase